jgi:hypothetical protein
LNGDEMAAVRPHAAASVHASAPGLQTQLCEDLIDDRRTQYGCDDNQLAAKLPAMSDG